MICIILTSPDGSQKIGLSTDGNANIGGVACLPNFLASVSELSHRANISMATGCVPEAIEWGFDLIDWDGMLRRSAAILAGTSQLVGWTADLYSDAVVVLYAGAFEVVGAVASGSTIAVSCRERWIGNTQTVGFGTGTNRVGLVAGGRQVSVKTPDIAEPSALEYLAWAGGISGEAGQWETGRPGESAAVSVTTDRCTEYWSDTLVACRCIDSSEAARLLIAATELADAGKLVVTGSEYSATTYPAMASGGLWAFVTVVFSVPADFRAREPDPSKIGIFSTDSAMRPIIGGATSSAGWINQSGRLVSPVGTYSLSDFVLSFSPRILSADGFLASTLIPCNIAYNGIGYTAPGSGLTYTGDTAAIESSGGAPVPSAFGFSGPINRGSERTIAFPFRLNVAPEDCDGFTRFFTDQYIDVVLSSTITVPPYGLTSPRNVSIQRPFCKSAETQSVGIVPTVIWWRPTGGLDLDSNLSYSSIQDLQLDGACGFTVTLDGSESGAVSVSLDAQSINLYGVSTLAFGSSYAVVQPGASPWWLTPVNPAQAASDLLDAIGGTMAASNPSYSVPAANWGRSFDQSATFMEAAKELADEFWFVLGRGANGTAAGSEGELPGPPSFTLGDRNDVVTEIVIEYDEWAGEYRRKAYVAHVDEAYDSSNPSRYFGGWDDDGAETGYGLAIWNACRKAWQIHGIKSSETIQAPSISQASVLGRLWTSTRNGVSRIQWLALQSRYVTLRIAESVPTWWAGNTVQIPLTVLDWAGYDLSAFAGVNLICTEKTWDPVTLTTTFEVALPPVTDTSTQKRIIQTLDATDRITQRLDATQRYIQVQG